MAGHTEKKAWHLHDVLKWCTGRFKKQGYSSPRLDAELMICAGLEIDRVGLYRDFDMLLAGPELARIRKLIERRLSGEPAAYILKTREFLSLEFKVDRRVLIPRPETEHLVLEAATHLGDSDALAADIGTGSGVIAVCLAKNTSCNVIATDLSPDALDVARANALRHDVKSRITFIQGDTCSPLVPLGPFDMVVSNPPYVTTKQWESLDPQVHDHEPRMALDGGNDGLDCIKSLVDQCPGVLKNRGWLLMEIGDDQAPAVKECFDHSGIWEDVKFIKDYSGKQRVVASRLK